MSSKVTAPVQTLNMIRPSPQRLLVVLLVVAAFLAVMHVVANVVNIEYVQAHFDLNEEKSIPTWWSSVQLGLLGVLLLLVARMESIRDRRAGRALNVGAAMAFYFSLDEVATLHEPLELALDRFEFVPRFGEGKGHWMAIYAVAGLVVLLLILPGLLSFSRKHTGNAIRFLIGAGIFVLGGVGVEFLYYQGYTYVILEETLEMGGVAVMVWATYRVLEETTLVFSVADDSLAGRRRSQEPGGGGRESNPPETESASHRF